MKSATHGGSGEARPDRQMGRQQTPKRVRRGSGAYRVNYQDPAPSTPVRQAMQKKANAKRRRRDRADEA